MQKLRRTTSWLAAGGLAAVLAAGGAAIAQDRTTGPGASEGRQAQDSGTHMHRHEGKAGKRGMRGGMHRGPMGMGMGGVSMKELRGLDLSDAQREQIRTLTTASRENSSARWRELGDIHRQIHDNIRANGFDEADARSRIESATPLLTELMLEQLRTQAAVREVLTPEQRTQLDARRAERKQRSEQRMEQQMEQRKKRMQEKSTS